MIINHEHTSDESQISDSSINASTSFRVSVCLRRYFKDHRARCYMQVTRNRRVRWLEKRIQKVFSLPQIFCLCSNGHLLPSTEPLALLDPGDSIEVIPLKETKEKHLNMRNESLNGSIAISDTTQTIFPGNLTLFGYEASQNNALVLDNEPINQNSESVLDENSTKLNSNIKHNKNVEHMVTDGFKSTFSLTNHEDINNQTKYDEADGEMETLQQVKRHALQLFSECGATTSEPPRRVRRRVRRRTRRAPEPSSAAPPLPLLVATSTSPQSCGGPHLRFSSPPHSSQTLSPLLAPRCSSPLEVARNEEVSARLPRVIRPLGIDN